MTPLGAKLLRQIAAAGPISLHDYMAACLGDAEFGYYLHRDPIGLRGDFTTSPEISQLFGEMIGIWIALVWQQLGSHGRVNLVELGPGRGTLMADVLRVSKRVQGLTDALDVHLVETSPVLRALQAGAMARAGRQAAWHRSVKDIPAGPTIFIANEFFDALPVRQYCSDRGAWHERMVSQENGRLVWSLKDDATGRDLGPGSDGDVCEVCDLAHEIAGDLAALIAKQGGAILAIDYGYCQKSRGDTLQAVARHRFVDPLEAPGEADLTANVDFLRLAGAMQDMGAQVRPFLTQEMFLRRMGIEARAMNLAKTNRARADEILAGMTRLIDNRPTGMGSLFKVLAATSGGIAAPAFDIDTRTESVQP